MMTQTKTKMTDDLNIVRTIKTPVIEGDTLHILIDGDMVIYESCSSCEREVDWGDGLWTLQGDASAAKAQVDERVYTIVNSILDRVFFNGNRYEVIMCLSDKKNFRKKILSTYKENRQGKRKPLGYYEVETWVKENYQTRSFPELEADDVVGILATTDYKGHEVHASGDKDYKSIPGLFYDFLHGDLYTISERDADIWWLTQTLTGDSADNYAGCPGIGKIGAERLLKKEGVAWGVVKRAFLKAGKTEEEAIQQARVARILRGTDYQDGNIRLFTPHT